MSDFVTRAEFDAYRALMLDTFGGLRDRVRDLERLVPTLFAAAESTASVSEEMSGDLFNGDEWRERLRRRGLDRLLSSMLAAPEVGSFTAGEVAAFKSLGALFNPAAADEGPCYNRDDNATTEGR